MSESQRAETAGPAVAEGARCLESEVAGVEEAEEDVEAGAGVEVVVVAAAREGGEVGAGPEFVVGEEA